jgi:hypothetical protein
VAFVYQWFVFHRDVKNAFLNDELREEVSMQSPPRYYIPGGMVSRIRCSLYGLKKASKFTPGLRASHLW